MNRLWDYVMQDQNLGVREDLFELISAGQLRVWEEDKERQEAFWEVRTERAKAMWQGRTVQWRN